MGEGNQGFKSVHEENAKMALEDYLVGVTVSQLPLTHHLRLLYALLKRRTPGLKVNGITTTRRSH